MALDIPRVEYDKKNKPSSSLQHRVSPNDPSIKLQEEANRKARDRRKQNEWQKIRLTETQTNTEHNG